MKKARVLGYLFAIDIGVNNHSLLSCSQGKGVRIVNPGNSWYTREDCRHMVTSTNTGFTCDSREPLRPLSFNFFTSYSTLSLCALPAGRLPKDSHRAIVKVLWRWKLFLLWSTIVARGPALYCGNKCPSSSMEPLSSTLVLPSLENKRYIPTDHFGHECRASLDVSTSHIIDIGLMRHCLARQRLLGQSSIRNLPPWAVPALFLKCHGHTQVLPLLPRDRLGRGENGAASCQFPNFGCQPVHSKIPGSVPR